MNSNEVKQNMKKTMKIPKKIIQKYKTGRIKKMKIGKEMNENTE